MGMHPKKLFTLALVILLLAILSIATLAWFNTTEVVTNTFYIGAAPGGGGSGGDGTVIPPFDFNVFGQRPDTDKNPEYFEDRNHYDNVLPASVLDKKVYFHNLGKYDQWVRLHLTFSDGDAWQKAITKAATHAGLDEETFIITKLLGGLNGNLLWEVPLIHHDIFGNDTMTLTFYYSDKVLHGEHILIMETLTIPGILDNADMDAFGSDGFSIVIKGEALQADEIPAANAREAFARVGWPTGESQP